MAENTRPNIAFFHVDNLGYGEPGCFGRLLAAFQASVKREPPIPAGASLDYVPKRAQ